MLTCKFDLCNEIVEPSTDFCIYHDEFAYNNGEHSSDTFDECYGEESDIEIYD